MIPAPADPDLALPEGWSARVPDGDDVVRLADMRARWQRRTRGSARPDLDAVAAEVVGTGSWTRRQLVLLDDSGVVHAWAGVHDRAAGRTMVQVTVSDELEERVADALADALYPWVAEVAETIAGSRGLSATQLDASSDDTDEWSRRWLGRHGYRKTRTWLQMTRPVTPDEATSLPAPRPGVVVRRVAQHETERGDGMPVAEDLQIVHLVLEESFADHFNSYRESFSEFVQRLREDPGHRWDHWWIAEVSPAEDAPDDEPVAIAGGSLVSSVLGPDADGVEGSYVDYIGVHRDARGRGVAKALLHTVIADAAERGRNRVGLEVDDDSPTGADGLYTSMGWTTSYRTESWHRDIDVAPELVSRPDQDVSRVD